MINFSTEIQVMSSVQFTPLSLPHSPLVPDGRLATPEKEVVPMLLKSHVVTNCDYVLLLFAQALICALCNGILPSIQSYASLPYGT